MTLSITTTPEHDRALAHLLAHDAFHGSNVGVTAEQYLQNEFDSVLANLLPKAEVARREYISEVMKNLTPEQIATLAETVWLMTNS
jgi:hypothetical protein